MKEVLQRRTFTEFFAGIGLMRLGLEKAGWTITFANDIDHDKYKMYSDHFQGAAIHFVIEDVHKLNPVQVPSATLATASFPCNDLSLAGARQGLCGKQSSAYWGFIRILEKMEERRPPIVLLENVSGFLTSNGGRDFQAALLALNRLGYAVDPMIIDAARFVPQSRVRLFIVGVSRNGRSAWEIHETPSFYESEIRPKPLAEFIFHHPEIVWRIRELPSLPKGSFSLKDILEDLPDDSPFWWSNDRCDYLVNQMSERHAAQLRLMMSAKTWSYGAAA